MDFRLFYRIAEHNICVHTPCIDSTRVALPSFEPFCVTEEQIAGESLLFSFLQGEVPDGTGFAPVYGMKNDHIAYEVKGHPDGRMWVNFRARGGREFQFALSADRKEVITNASLTETENQYYINILVKMAYCICSAPHQTTKMHASVIEKDGRALLFLGTSGTGKSTHSQLWLKYVPGCSLLNDDEPIVRIQNRKVYVYGSPWSGKTVCYRSAKASVEAMVRLYQHPQNQLQRLSGLSAVEVLWEAAGILDRGKDTVKKIFKDQIEIAATIPIYQLNCRPDEGAVSLTRALIP